MSGKSWDDRGDELAEPGPPWPLTREEIDLFATALSVVRVEVRSGRWVAEFTRSR